MKDREVLIVDTTLRDGEQMPGLVFTPQQKAYWAQQIALAGVKEIEAVTPAMGQIEKEAFDQISEAFKNENISANIYSWNRLREEDIEASLEWGVQHLFVSAPVSDRYVESLMKITFEQLLQKFEDGVKQVVGRGANVVCGLMDIKRADFGKIVELAACLSRAGARRIRLSDTNGTLTPLEVYRLISRLKKSSSIPLEFHAHNDFGMAGANSLAAAEAGASYIDTTILGIGERAGNARMEEVVMALEQLSGLQTGVDIQKMNMMGRKFAMEQGISISSNRPVLGEKIFHHESGIHVAALEKQSEIYEPWTPGLTGSERKIILGKHSGLGAVALFCRRHHLRLDSLSEKAALEKIKNRAHLLRRGLTESEAMQLLLAFRPQKKAGDIKNELQHP